MELQRVHRVDQNKPVARRPIIARFLRFPNRERVFKRTIKVMTKGKTQEAMANIKKKTREEGELACLTRRNQTSYSLKEILFLYNVM